MIDFTAEHSLIGSILISPGETLPLARAIVRISDILDERASAAYKAACELYDAKETIDPVSVIDRAQRYAQGTNGNFLIDCMNTALTAANVRIYAEAVHNGAIRRSIRALGAELAEGSPLAPQEILISAIAGLQGLQTGSSAKPEEPVEDASNFYNYLSDTAAGLSKPFLSTGFKKLDDLLGGGIVSSGLVTLAARPGVGKTVVGLNIADNIAGAGNPVLYVSLEMDKTQLMCRRVGRHSKLSYNRLQRGDIGKDDTATWARIADALSVLSQRPLYISDKPASIADIELKARSIPDLALIVIDHMGLIRPDNYKTSLYQQTTETSHAEKSLALSMGIPILSLCQLNRESEGRIDHRPCLADLRNAGAIEEDSDAVILLHRPAMYLPDAEKPQAYETQSIETIVAKNRHGATGVNNFEFYGTTATINE